MFENICTLPLTSELFAQALHPSEPVLAVGLSSGHVQTFRLPSDSSADDDDGNTSVLSTGTATIDTEWRTRRHKGSCRTLAYSHDGEALYSAGTDGLLKVASSTTGQVTSKLIITVPSASGPNIDPPTLIHALSPQTLLLGTDSSALHIYDLRTPLLLSASKPAQTHHPHDDYISSLTPLPPSNTSTSGFPKQWVSTGGSTLAVTDLRRGVLKKSEDEEEELLSSVFVSGLRHKPRRGTGEKVLVGGGDGVLTLWERGVWDDQGERIVVDKEGGESLDCLVERPDEVGRKEVVVGVGDGTCRVVRLGVNKVVEVLRHDEVEGVVGVGFDVEGRLISGGGRVVKVWEEGVGGQKDDEAEMEMDGEKRALDSDDDVGEKDDSSEEEVKPKKKRKRNKGRGKKGLSNGILGFKGLE